MKRRRVLVIVVLLLLAAVLGYWLLPLRGPEPAALPPTGDDLAEADQPAPAAPIANAPASRLEPRPAPTERADVPAQPSVAPVQPPPDEAAHVPAYGEGLKRGGSRATFEIRDANGIHVLNMPVKATLYRAVGERWVHEGAQVAGQTITAAGFSDTGLEQGRYELEVSAGMYGDFRYPFELGRAESRQAELRMPFAQRVICFRFVDAQDNAVAWINHEPVVTAEPIPVQPTRREGRPAGVLRDRNTRDRPAERKVPERRPTRRDPRESTSSRGERGIMACTDAGRFFVSVAAGRKSVIEFTFDRRIWGRFSARFEDTFLAREWDDYPVVINLAQDFEALTQNFVRKLEDDPGCRSLLYGREPRPPVEPITDPARLPPPDRGKCRVFFDFTPDPAINARYIIDVASRRDAYSLTPGLAYVDLSPGTRGRAYTTDADTFMAGPVEFTVPPEPEFRIDLKRRLAPASIQAVRATPTLEAWALRHWCNILPDEKGVPDKAPAEDLIQWNAPQAPDGHHRLRFGGVLEEQVATAETVNLFWFTIGAGHAGAEGAREGGFEPKPAAPAMLAAMPLERPGLPQIIAARPEHKPGGLCLRVVGPDGAGLAWAEASLVPYAIDRDAGLLREYMQRTGQRDGEVEWTGFEKWLAESAAGDEREPYVARPAELAADSARMAELRKWLSAQRGWYSTADVLRSDDHGYMVSPGGGLAPGRKYVLYLWTNSRNSSRPDARVVIETGPGLTDMGLFHLPTYLLE